MLTHSSTTKWSYFLLNQSPLYWLLQKNSFTLPLIQVLPVNQFLKQTTQPPRPWSRPQNTIVLTHHTRARTVPTLTPRTPPSIRELTASPFEEIAVNSIKNHVVLLELPGEWSVTENHSPVVPGTQGPRVLLGRCVPHNVVEIVVDRRVSVGLGVAY